jgi:uncharacterized membrane protein
LIDRLEHATELDPVAVDVSTFWTAVLRGKHLRDILSGRQLGHALHPAAALVTGGTLLSATVLDVTGDQGARDSARRLVGIGLLCATLTVLAGWSDWIDTEDAEKRVGLVHAATNTLALTSYTFSWWRRRHGHDGTAASMMAAAVLGLGGWLGGHLVFAQGVGVDTTAFGNGPFAAGRGRWRGHNADSTRRPRRGNG